MGDITATTLLRLLEQKHEKEVFVPECKNGPTHSGPHCRLDAWAMKKSWSKPCVYGYEIKVSRSDFMQDDKWPSYLTMCNQLYFVCPAELIDKDELPADVGLIWASKNGAKLYTKKKAPFRDVNIPEDLFRYLLMCRTVITREYGRYNKRDFWERWLENKAIDRDFGHHVRYTLAKRIDEEITKVQLENERLKNMMDGYDDIRELLKELGHEPEQFRRISRWAVERQIKEALQVIPRELLSSLDQVARQAGRAKEALEAFESIPANELQERAQ